MDFPRKMIVVPVEKAAEPHVFKADQPVLPEAVAQQDAAGFLGMPFHQCGKFLYVDAFQIFVAVDAENPVIGSFADRIVFSGAEIIAPVEVIDLIGISGREGQGIVGGARIDQNYLTMVGFQGFQAFFYVAFFISGNDTNGYRQHCFDFSNLGKAQ
jgi:hypothetical protein